MLHIPPMGIVCHQLGGTLYFKRMFLNSQGRFLQPQVLDPTG